MKIYSLLSKIWKNISFVYLIFVSFFFFLIFDSTYRIHNDIKNLEKSIKFELKIEKITESRKTMPRLIGRIHGLTKGIDSNIYNINYYKIKGKELEIGELYPVWYNYEMKFVTARLDDKKEKMKERYIESRNNLIMVNVILILIATFLQYAFNEMEKEKNNKKKVFSILLLLSIAGLDLSAQSPKDTRGDQIILAVSNKPINVFTVYPANTISKGSFQNISQAKNSTPEQVFEAILSETSFEWTKHISIGGEIKPKKDESYTKIKKMDKAANFYLLRCKWEFEAAGSQYAIVKFDFQNQEGKKATGAYTLVKKDGRWFKHEKAYTTNVCLLFIAFKEEVLKTLFEGKTTDNSVHNVLLKEINTPNGIDLDKFFKLYDNWEKGKDNDKINYFLDPTSWINQK